jgi:hypothetical protein
MQFSTDSEFFLKFLIDEFETFIKKETRPEQLSKDKIFKMLFYDIEKSFNEVKNLDIRKKTFSTRELKQPSLALSSFVSSSAQDKIKNGNGNVIQYNTSISVKRGTNFYKHKIEINFITYDDPLFSNNYKYDKYNLYVIAWLNFVFIYSSVHCSKELTVFFYLTDEKKTLPTRYVQILGPENCNSAVTTGCMEKTEILIYRKEEWFKVFLHETFHCLGLDLAGFETKEFKKKIKSIFPLENIDITETYAEFWATIFNCLFCSYILLDKNIKKKEDLIEQFLQYSTFCIKFEQIFALFQTVKILNFMGVEYQSLYRKDSISASVRKYLYKEKTNVFAYYILKSLFLYFYNDFVVWCNKNNNRFDIFDGTDEVYSIIRFRRTPQNLTSFFKFIEKKYNSESFLQVLKRMKKFYLDIKTSKINEKYNEAELDKFLTTARMTVCELVITDKN